MSTNFQEEFNKIFSNGCSISGWDWNRDTNKLHDSLNNDCYAAEAALISSLTSEAYNKYGFEVEYYIKDIDTKIDEILGEDPLHNFIRRFKLNVYTESIPQLQNQYLLQGIIFNELVTIQCTIQHWKEACQLDFITGEKSWDEILPKIGDVIYIKWMDLYYEVLNVKEFAEGTSFQSVPITYTFSLRPWRNAHENVDEFNNNDDEMEHLRSYVELGETFNVDTDLLQKPSTVNADKSDMLAVNKYVEEKKQKQVIYTDKKTDNIKIDPFNGW